MCGWIALHRSIANDPMWTSEKFTDAQAWVDMLLSANFKDGSFIVKRQTVSVKRGQLGWSMATYEKRWRWSRNKVRRYFSMLEKDGKISTETNHLTTIVTICNYDKFQEMRIGSDPSKRTPSEPSDDLQYNKVKKVNKVKDNNTSTGVDFFPVIQRWNEVANELGLQKILGVTSKRKTEIKNAYANYKKACKDFGKEPKDMIGFLIALIECANVTHTEFHLGGADRDKWKMNFDYLMQKKVIYKVTETGSIA